MELHRNLELVNQALKAHRHGATIRDLSEWTRCHATTTVKYNTVRNCLLTLRRLGIARVDVVGAQTGTSKKWFSRKILD